MKPHGVADNQRAAFMAQKVNLEVKGVIARKGGEQCKIAILAWGSMLHPALAAAEKLDATVANMRFVKPLDEALVRELAATHDLLVTVEEASVPGSAGGAVTEFLTAAGLGNRVLLLGLPDRFIDQGDPAILLASAGLDAAGIERNIRAAMQSRGGEDGRQVAA